MLSDWKDLFEKVNSATNDLESLAGITPTIENFFEKVLVMEEGYKECMYDEFFSKITIVISYFKHY